MADKTITAVSTSLALMQIQVTRCSPLIRLPLTRGLPSTARSSRSVY